MSLVTQDGQQAILDQIFQDSPLPIAIYDASGVLLQANYAQMAFTEGLGELTGIGDFNAINDLRSERHGHREQFKRALSGEAMDYEFRVLTQTNMPEQDLYFSRLLMPLFNESAEVHAVVSVLVDTTDRRREEDARTQMQEQLLHTQKLESLGVMAGGIAHDFNNLLVGVLGNASLLLETMDKASPHYPSIQSIETSARRAAEVAAQMLAYAGKGDFSTESLDLSELVREVSELLKITVSGRAFMNLSLADHLPLITADATQLRQIIMNLIGNAADAIRETSGSQLGSLDVTTGIMPRNHKKLQHCYGNPSREAVQFVYFEVTDNGVGMDDDTIRRIFDPFFTTKVTGRGLGLSSVLGIVSRHEGGLAVESTPGSGTTMTAMFPAISTEDSNNIDSNIDSNSERPQTERSSEESTPAERQLLVVDDEEAVRSILVSMLEALGYQVLVANSGKQAEDLMIEHPVDLVLLDLTMPGQDGLETGAHLLATWPELTIIYMSGYDAETVPDEAIFLHKPFTLNTLRETVNEALQA